MTEAEGVLVHIGDVAERTGLSHRTIRYYEEMGLVEPAARTEGGFRLYDDAGIERLLLIKPMKPLGFSIGQIRDLLGALDTLADPSSTAAGLAAATALVQQTHASAQERIAELRASTASAEAFTRRLGRVEPPTRTQRQLTRRPNDRSDTTHMSARFEELAWASTPIGELSLRRRREPVTGTTVHEVKLGDEFLMSSLFTTAEEELARLALGRLTGTGLRVVVGGLGLGYTARTVLEDERVGDLVVVDALEPVIDWHRQHLVPLGEALTADRRCRLVHGDFFTMTAGGGFDPDGAGSPVDAVIVDIDHSPRHLLADGSASFYQTPGTEALARLIRPGGVYALWSNDPPDESYLDILRPVFTDVVAEVVEFPNPLQERAATNTIYLATRRP